MTKFHFKQLLDEVFCDDIRKSQSQGYASLFMLGFRLLGCVEPGRTRYTGSYFVVRSRLQNAPVQWKCLSANENEFPRIREQSFPYVTSFSCDFVALMWYLCFQCLRWRITYRKFTKNSTTKASKQERYDLVSVMLTCCDFT